MFLRRSRSRSNDFMANHPATNPAPAFHTMVSLGRSRRVNSLSISMAEPKTASPTPLAKALIFFLEARKTQESPGACFTFGSANFFLKRRGEVGISVLFLSRLGVQRWTAKLRTE